MNALLEFSQLVFAATLSFALALLLGWLAARGLFRLMPKLLPASGNAQANPQAVPKPHLVHSQAPLRRVLQVIRGGRAPMNGERM
jgi:hypothetical protein